MPAKTTPNTPIALAVREIMDNPVLPEEPVIEMSNIDFEEITTNWRATTHDKCNRGNGLSYDDVAGMINDYFRPDRAVYKNHFYQLMHLGDSEIATAPQKINKTVARNLGYLAEFSDKYSLEDLLSLAAKTLGDDEVYNNGFTKHPSRASKQHRDHKETHYKKPERKSEEIKDFPKRNFVETSDFYNEEKEVFNNDYDLKEHLDDLVEQLSEVFEDENIKEHEQLSKFQSNKLGQLIEIYISKHGAKAFKDVDSGELFEVMFNDSPTPSPSTYFVLRDILNMSMDEILEALNTPNQKLVIYT